MLGREYRAYPEIAGTVRFLNCWDGARVALVEEWVAEMGSIYPSIKVESDVGDATSMRDRLVTALASGSPPNAVMLKSDSIAYFADRAALLPLDDLLARDGIDQQWFGPTAPPSRVWEGRTYGLPQTPDGIDYLLFVNLGLLEKIGVDPARPIRTWQDLEALIEPARQHGLLVMDPARVAVGTTAHQVWTYANGGRYWDDEVRKIAWTEPPALQAAEWLLRFAREQAPTLAQPSGSGDALGAISATEWAAERHVCCVNGAGWPSQLRQQAPNVRYAAYAFPSNAASPGSRGETPALGGWTVAIPAQARDREAAWEWLKLIAVSESACVFAERQRRPSPLAGCNEWGGLATSQPLWPIYRASLSASVRVPTLPIQPQLEERYRQLQADLLSERLRPGDALEAAARDAQKLLDDWHTKRKRG